VALVLGTHSGMACKLPFTQERSAVSPLAAHSGSACRRQDGFLLPADSDRDVCSVLAQMHTDMIRKPLEVLALEALEEGFGGNQFLWKALEEMQEVLHSDHDSWGSCHSAR
jgi:hypothetical protein